MPTRVNFESQIKLIPIESACKYATTTNIPFSSISTIDGFSLATNDRILVWQQTLPEENGIYIVSGGTNLIRANGSKLVTDFKIGQEVFVYSGATNAKKLFYLKTDVTTIGVSPIVYDVVNAGITSYTNPADNRVLTSVSSSGINAEANLTFNGSVLTVNSNSSSIGSSGTENTHRFSGLNYGSGTYSRSFFFTSWEGTLWEAFNSGGSVYSKPPIVAIINNETPSQIKSGLHLMTTNSANNTYAPALTFGADSVSGGYHNAIGAITAKKLSSAYFDNFSTGQLEFFATRPGSNSDVEIVFRDPNMTISTGVGIGYTSAPQVRGRLTVLEKIGINNSTPTVALDVIGAGLFTSNITANSFIKSGGTSSQFLKADGSVDANTYLTTSSAASTYLPLAGGTLSGKLTVSTTNHPVGLEINNNYASYDEGIGLMVNQTSTGYSGRNIGITSNAYVIYNYAIGIKGTATHQDMNGLGVAYGVFGNVIANSTSNGANGTTYAGYFSNDATVDGNNYGLFVNTSNKGDYGIYQTGTGINYFGSNSTFAGALSVGGGISNTWTSAYANAPRNNGAYLYGNFYNLRDSAGGQSDGNRVTLNYMNSQDEFTAAPATIYYGRFNGFYNQANIIYDASFYYHSTNQFYYRAFSESENKVTFSIKPSFTVNTITGTKADLYLSGDAQIDRSLNIGTTLGVTGAATFSSSATATSFVKSGGTSSQFLKADGSVDANTYLTTSSAASTYLPLAGGTLTGALNGTTGIFTTRLGVGSIEPVSVPTLFTSGFGDQEIHFTHSDNIPGRKVSLRLTNGNNTFYTYGGLIYAVQGAGLNEYGRMTLGINTTEIMHLTRFSRVGIMNNSPSYTLDVSGTFNATGNSLIGGTLGVTGAATLSSTLGVTGAATLSSTLGVTGAATLSSTLGVTGLATLSGDLYNTGNEYFYDNTGNFGDQIKYRVINVYAQSGIQAVSPNSDFRKQQLVINGVQVYEYSINNVMSLTILNAATLDVISTTHYSTYNNATNVNSLATAMNDMTISQIGIITTWGGWDFWTFTSSNGDALRAAALNAGLTKLGTSYFHVGGNFRGFNRRYVAVFYGGGNITNVRNRDVIEVMLPQTEVGRKTGGLYFKIITNGENGTILGATSVNALYAATPVGPSGSGGHIALICDYRGYVGIGTTNPAYQLELSTDSAAKPTTSTWTISSDIRLKENIETADLDRCYDIVNQLPLKRYRWKDDIYGSDQIKDRSKLGWIAQDVESIFPKAVGITPFKYNRYNTTTKPVLDLDGSNIYDENGNIVYETIKEIISEETIEDCKDLNVDQIYAVMYGTIKKLINIVEDNKTQIDMLKIEIDNLKSMN